MKVYVVSHGYYQEGSIVVKVFSKEEDAANYILNLPPEIEEDEGGGNIEHKWEEEVGASVIRYFTNNWGEYYTINECEVV